MRHISTLSLILAVTAAAGACRVEPAGAAPPPPYVEVTTAESWPADSACFNFAWTAATDEAGPATSYDVVFSWLDDSAPREIRRSVAERQTSQCWARAPGVARIYSIDVYSVRRGVPSDSASHREWTWVDADVAPPAPGPITVDSSHAREIPPPVDSTPAAGDGSPTGEPPVLSALFDAPAAQSPRFTDKRRTLSDMCYCDAWKDTSARAFDGILSGQTKDWLALNPTIQQDPYILMWSTLDEGPDDAGKTDPNSLTGKFQADARAWFAAHPQYQYEAAWLHDTAAGAPADSAHRLHPKIWHNWRFIGNPLDPGWRAYTLDRFRRSRAERPGSTGLFIDELDPANLGLIGKSREFAGQSVSVWQDAIVAQLKELRDSLGVRLQMNAAGYSGRDFPVRLGIAAGSMHLETMNHATQDLPPVWALVDSLVRHDVYIDLVNLESWYDFHGGSRKLSDGVYYPRGNYGEPVFRAKVVQLASYYMVVPANEQMVGLMDNGVRAAFGLSPDSVDLRIYYLHVGEPKGPRSVWLDTRDPIGQRARVYRRDFEDATVLIRPVAYWADTTFSDTTAVPVPLPEGGPWSYVQARGSTVPIDSLSLRLSEAVILVRREP